MTAQWGKQSRRWDRVSQGRRRWTLTKLPGKRLAWRKWGSLKEKASRHGEYQVSSSWERNILSGFEDMAGRSMWLERTEQEEECRRLWFERWEELDLKGLEGYDRSLNISVSMVGGSKFSDLHFSKISPDVVWELLSTGAEMRSSGTRAGYKIFRNFVNHLLNIIINQKSNYIHIYVYVYISQLDFVKVTIINNKNSSLSDCFMRFHHYLCSRGYLYFFSLYDGYAT